MEQLENGPALWLAGGGRASSQPALAPACLSAACPGARSSGAEALQTRVHAWNAETEAQLHPAVALSATPAASPVRPPLSQCKLPAL